jgi:hypothetical protein
VPNYRVFVPACKMSILHPIGSTCDGYSDEVGVGCSVLCQIVGMLFDVFLVLLQF